MGGVVSRATVPSSSEASIKLGMLSHAPSRGQAPHPVAQQHVVAQAQGLMQRGLLEAALQLPVHVAEALLAWWDAQCLPAFALLLACEYEVLQVQRDVHHLVEGQQAVAQAKMQVQHGLVPALVQPLAGEALLVRRGAVTLSRGGMQPRKRKGLQRERLHVAVQRRAREVEVLARQNARHLAEGQHTEQQVQRGLPQAIIKHLAREVEVLLVRRGARRPVDGQEVEQAQAQTQGEGGPAACAICAV
eukprot:CAMPEP_0175667806 /NCGR_PEP_ID=MMETSP0097-20121207/18297_1 /TAXON_ID=311494 /ORGANISM="Alexandrium monilatum, Strain CCMP3105" /LENGTH=245 /DNA_ID=CAMNT_0016974287 /DNA_START=98 /DNA_END=833 /DNA_ORIENTATION=-